jgi:hypothetical protein
MRNAKTNLIVALKKAIRMVDSEFKESDHPRASNGQFGGGGGGGSGLTPAQQKRAEKEMRPQSAAAKAKALKAMNTPASKEELSRIDASLAAERKSANTLTPAQQARADKMLAKMAAEKKAAEEKEGKATPAEKKEATSSQPKSWGSETSTPSGEKKSALSPRDRTAITNTGKFTKMENAVSARDGQKYRTNVLKGEGGQLWVPATNREESILKRLGYKEAK